VISVGRKNLDKKKLVNFFYPNSSPHNTPTSN
jgi:hypothetical protein